MGVMIVQRGLARGEAFDCGGWRLDLALLFDTTQRCFAERRPRKEGWRLTAYPGLRTSGPAGLILREGASLS